VTGGVRVGFWGLFKQFIGAVKGSTEVISRFEAPRPASVVGVFPEVRALPLCSEALSVLANIQIPHTRVCCVRYVVGRRRVKAQDSYLPSS
jgi:hypothetical protein